MLRVVKMLLKGEVGGCALDSHRNYIVDHGKSRKNHGIVFLNFCGNPVLGGLVFSSPEHWLKVSYSDPMMFAILQSVLGQQFPLKNIFS